MLTTTVSSLEKDIERLEREIRQLKGETDLSYTCEPPSPPPAVGFVKTEIHRQHGELYWWLEAVGVSKDAPDDLKRFVAHHRLLNVADIAGVTRLTLAVAGKRSEAEWPGIKESIAVWDELSEDVRAALVAIVGNLHGCICKLRRGPA